ncbi:MAG: hypothetical protein GY812_16495 [Actinomycetia bacterium]|nr:hypothetical protein [Actinomycetes bacterium]
MIPYASRTGTRRNLKVLRDNGWRLMVSARGVLRNEGFPYSLDNGAWTAFQKGEPFDEKAFVKAVDLLGANADFVVAPDIVAGGVASLAKSVSWLAWCLERTELVLIAVQDGLTAGQVMPYLGPRVGVFLGGSTDWKHNTMRAWGDTARACGAYFHVGRINSARFIRRCHDAGADSFDGSGPSRFAVEAERLSRELQQQPLFRGIPA